MDLTNYKIIGWNEVQDDYKWVKNIFDTDTKQLYMLFKDNENSNFLYEIRI